MEIALYAVGKNASSEDVYSRSNATADSLTGDAMLAQRVADAHSRVHGDLRTVAGDLAGLAHPSLAAVQTLGSGSAHRQALATPTAVLGAVWLLAAPPLPALHAQARPGGQVARPVTAAVHALARTARKFAVVSPASIKAAVALACRRAIPCKSTRKLDGSWNA